MIVIVAFQYVVDAGFLFVVQMTDEAGNPDEEEQGGWGDVPTDESVLAERLRPEDLEELEFSSDLVSCYSEDPSGATCTRIDEED